MTVTNNNMKRHFRNSRGPTNRGSRSGAALLFCMFILFVVTLMVINVLNSQTLLLASLRNTIDYERALFLANAGIHQAVAELEADKTWRGTVTDGAYPADDTHSATAADGPNNTVTVTSSGVAGEVTRSVVATIQT